MANLVSLPTKPHFRCQVGKNNSDSTQMERKWVLMEKALFFTIGEISPNLVTLKVVQFLPIDIVVLLR
jgi:hypothetical protein